MTKKNVAETIIETAASLTVKNINPDMSDELKMLAVALLFPSKGNARKSSDPKKFAELLASIQQDGIQVPLRVRPIGDGFYVSAGGFGDIGPVRYLAIKNIVGHENLLETFSGGTAEENQADAEQAVAREKAKVEYEIVAGHRRFEVAKKLRIAQVPCIIRRMSDEEARQIGIIDNLQREDLPALDEALAFSELLREPGALVESVAAKVGLAPSYVARRLKLLDAAQPVREALTAGAIDVGHALDLARLTEPQQLRLLSELDCGFDYRTQEEIVEEEGRQMADDEGVCKHCGCTEEDPCMLQSGPCAWTNAAKTVCNNPDCVLLEQEDHISSDWHPTGKTVAELRRMIGRIALVLLSTAPFPLDADLPPINCIDCPKRTKNAPLLFDDGGQDLCTDRDCFESKCKVWVKAELQRADEEKEPLLMLADENTDSRAAVRRWDVTVLEGNKVTPCSNQEEAIWINGKRTGHHVFICRNRTCKQHGGRNSSGTRSNDDRKADRSKLLLKVRLVKAYRFALFEAIARTAAPADAIDVLNVEALTWAINRANSQYGKKMAEALGWEENIFRYDGKKALRAKIASLKPADRARVALLAAHSPELAVPEYQVDSKADDLEQLATMLKIDHKKIRSMTDAVVNATAKKQTPAKKVKPKATPKKSPKAKPAKKIAKKPAKKIGKK